MRKGKNIKLHGSFGNFGSLFFHGNAVRAANQSSLEVTLEALLAQRWLLAGCASARVSLATREAAIVRPAVRGGE